MNECCRCLATKPDDLLDVLPGGKRICKTSEYGKCMPQTPDMFRPQAKPGGCWTCVYQKIGQIDVLGSCIYFEKLGKPPKPIPQEVVDKGCRFKEEKKRDPGATQAAGP